MSGQEPQISEILFDKIKNKRWTDKTTNELLQNAYENVNVNIQFIKKVIKIVNLENTLLKKFLESEGLYEEFVEYAEDVCEAMEQKVESRKRTRKRK